MCAHVSLISLTFTSITFPHAEPTVACPRILTVSTTTQTLPVHLTQPSPPSPSSVSADTPPFPPSFYFFPSPVPPQAFSSQYIPTPTPIFLSILAAPAFELDTPPPSFFSATLFPLVFPTSIFLDHFLHLLPLTSIHHRRLPSSNILHRFIINIRKTKKTTALPHHIRKKTSITTHYILPVNTCLLQRHHSPPNTHINPLWVWTVKIYT